MLDLSEISEAHDNENQGNSTILWLKYSSQFRDTLTVAKMIVRHLGYKYETITVNHRHKELTMIVNIPYETFIDKVVEEENNYDDYDYIEVENDNSTIADDEEDSIIEEDDESDNPSNE
jgi:hypothetical protein